MGDDDLTRDAAFTRGDDELRMLRARAYGPDAGILSDADAQRLSQLESQGFIASVTEPPPTDVAVPVSPPEAPRATRRRWLVPALWAGSLVATAVVAITITAAVTPPAPPPAETGATPVTRLSEDVTWDVPRFFGSDGSLNVKGYQDFYGLRVILGTYGERRESSQVDECLSVIEAMDAVTATVDNFSGNIYSGCAADAFPARVAFNVTVELPRELRAEFPEGSALEFVFDRASGDVFVYSSSAGE
ncbi:hypothetical protein [Microbacterium sp. P04]|uniref:hypothetical protein n=1 Tax=Microbacterium sp. P04 TaxID=3366947 RepID=UPI0037465677